MLTVAYGEATLDRSNVYRWYKMFSEGQEDVNDEERAGRPSTSTTDEEINEVEKMILANRRITVREVAEDLNISIGSCHSIFINDLGMRRVAAKFVPKLLNCDQKQHHMNIANEMLDSVRDDQNLLQRVITGDEAWVYGYDVETKAQSSQWKLPHEPRPKKARQVRSNVKVLLTVFFDCRGVVHHEFLPQGRTVNKEYYLQVMRNLREAIRQKRPDLWKNKNWLLHHDNAPAHTSLLVRDFLAKNNTLMMPQLPYSPDLAPCDFFLFPKLKRPMKGRRYATLDEIKTASKEELKKKKKKDFLKCFEDWKNRWHKCIISHGDYFEGDKIENGELTVDDPTVLAVVTAPQRFLGRLEPTARARSLFSPLQFPTKDTSLVSLVLAEQPLVMELPLVSPVICELRSVIRFLAAKKNSAKDIHTELCQVYEKGCMSSGMVRRWVREFKNGRTDVHDEPRAGRPSVSDETIAKLCDLVPDVSKTTIDKILREHLGYSKVCAIWVPKMLTEDHKRQRVDAAQKFLNCHKTDGEEFLDSIVTGDETWVHCTTPEIKEQSKQWKHTSSPKPLKFKQTLSAGKLMATVFWDRKGLLLCDFMRRGTTINSDR
ncbi:hypothetical protein LAZ67_2005879 [Cordylochernes scorpioides]|uniref:Mos1 transposase HTH domain-containing protein n=1 Tax=Cordylochernes scorpioides TaxID=51811 RepID=A0ABY6K6E2_9ARAC|nr:hypothetical protein LAZ67_2005879 [Cordylochernes scorpioides]